MWDKLSLWHIDLIPLMFHSRGTAGSYISPWSYQCPLPSVLWKCSLLLPWGSLSSIFLIKVTLTIINTSPLSFVLSLSITKLKTTCMSSLESVCSGQLPVLFICYLLTGLFGFRMYHEQWLSKCTAWNCPLLSLGEDPSLWRFFFSLCLWFLVLKIPTFVLLLELWWEQQKFRTMWGNFPLLFCFFLGFRSCIKPFINLILFVCMVWDSILFLFSVCGWSDFPELFMEETVLSLLCGFWAFVKINWPWMCASTSGLSICAFIGIHPAHPCLLNQVDC